MAPEQKIKATIMLRCQPFIESLDDGTAVDAENVDELWDRYREDCDDDGGEWCSQDEIEEFRSGQRETGLDTKEFSRHYESDEVAARMLDGSWIGWTFWYGGGKHGEPQAIDWMSDAYELDYAAEEKLVLVETFTRKP